MSVTAEDLRCMPVADVAETLAVSRQAVYELIETGRLAAVQVGRRKVVQVSVLEEFIRNGGAA